MLIDDGAPLAWDRCASVEHRRALLTQAMQLAAPVIGKSAAPLPPAGADALFDQRLASNAIETEPLFLIMAGIVAVESDAPAALALGRLDLAELVADAERSRLQRLARAAGADESLVLHLAACVTLQAGCGAVGRDGTGGAGARSARRPIDHSHRSARGAAARAACPDKPAKPSTRCRPDLIGEAFLLKEIRPAPRQVEAVERAFRRAGRSVIGMVIRTAQDHAQGDGGACERDLAGPPGTADRRSVRLDGDRSGTAGADAALRERAAEITAPDSRRAGGARGD